MAGTVDFKALKERVYILEVATMLGLTLKQQGEVYRGRCPRCEKDRVLVISPDKASYYCHHEKKGGDCIALVCHVKGMTAKAAAQEIITHCGVSKRDERKEASAPDGLARVKDYLIWKHDAVQALGLDPATAEALGIGYAPKGIMRQRVVFPCYHDGKLIGYGGFSPDLDPQLKFPNNLAERLE